MQTLWCWNQKNIMTFEWKHVKCVILCILRETTLFTISMLVFLMERSNNFIYNIYIFSTYATTDHCFWSFKKHNVMFITISRTGFLFENKQHFPLLQNIYSTKALSKLKYINNIPLQATKRVLSSWHNHIIKG
jgi:hypothetical protein